MLRAIVVAALWGTAQAHWDHSHGSDHTHSHGAHDIAAHLHHSHSDHSFAHSHTHARAASCACADATPLCSDSGGCYAVANGADCNDGGGPQPLCDDCTACDGGSDDGGGGGDDGASEGGCTGESQYLTDVECTAWQAVFDATGGSGWSARARAAAPRATRRLRSTVEGLRGKRGAREGVCVPRSSLRAKPRSARTVIIAIDPRARRPPSIVVKTHTPLVDAPRRPDSPLPFPSPTPPRSEPNAAKAARSDPCAFQHLTICSDDGVHLLALDLGNRGLSGALPDALGDLTHLTYLQVSRRSPAPGGA